MAANRALPAIGLQLGSFLMGFLLAAAGCQA